MAMIDALEQSRGRDSDEKVVLIGKYEENEQDPFSRADETRSKR